MSDSANWRSKGTTNSANPKAAHGNRKRNQSGQVRNDNIGPCTASEARKAREQRFNSSENNTDTLANKFEHLSFVSRSVGDSGLRDRNTQRALFEHLNERIRRLRNADSSDSSSQSTEFDPILSSFRKLREGIVSRAVYDAFTIQVYEQSVDLCLEAGNYAELLKSLTHLVTIVYPQAVASASVCELFAALSNPLSLVNDIYPSINQTPRRGEYSSLLLLYILCYIPANKKPQGDNKLNFDTREFMTLLLSMPAETRESSAVKTAIQLQRALLDNLDFVSFRKGLNQLSNAGKKMAHHIAAYVRRRTFQIITKAYHTYPVALLQQYLVCDLGCDSEDEMEKVLVEVLGAGYASRVSNGVVQLRVAKKRA
ncbi:hypothetical protein CcCBS67573_g07078 [Chytriomyces confervae]|uniref:SAC3/GANP/THP3 conserved domain-containing protein n=1 Tax=Chytriomyces confervae TaxID=246404 RepID=A0A507EXR2_9FUNG|nr:hypothetical protein CcCBS67573_g07078 [Chytriomyces confervae]